MAKAKEEFINYYIPISRKLFEHALWKEDRVFSRAEAWIDLLRSVSWAEDNEKVINGRLVKWNRGEMPVSLRYLGSRWKWSVGRVSRFLEELRKESMAETDTASGTVITVIKICKYDDYNPVSKKTKQDAEQGRNRDGTPAEQGRNKIKNSNKVKEGEERDAHTPDENSLFTSFSGWIEKYAPKVNQMKEPITIKQFLKLRKDFPDSAGKVLIQDIMLSMQNTVALLKKYESANLTIRSWINMRNKRNGEPVNGSKSKISEAATLINQEQQAGS